MMSATRERPNHARTSVKQEISHILTSTFRVAVKGFVVGGSLYAGLELLSSVSSTRIFTRYGRSY